MNPLFLMLHPVMAKAPNIMNNIHTDYLVGHPIIVHLHLSNSGTTPIKVPNLENESWRIKFQIRDQDGREQTRGTRPDSLPPPSFWEIDPRQSRHVWVEVPGSAGLRAGQYELSFSVALQEESQQSQTYGIQIQPPQQVSADLSLHSHPLSHNSNPSLWVNKSSSGYDVYFHHSAVDNHKETLYHGFALHSEDQIEPLISISQGGARQVLWQSDDRRISYQTFQNNQPRGSVQTLAIPWPSANLMGSPVTHSDGSPQFLLWVPNPVDGGELRWCSVQDNGIPIYRKLQTLKSMPEHLTQSMTETGEALIAFIEDSTLKLYTSTIIPQRPDLPLKGTQLLDSISGTVRDLQFSLHPEEGQVLQLLIQEKNGALRQDSHSLSGELLSQTSIAKDQTIGDILAFSPHPTSPAVIVDLGNQTLTLMSEAPPKPVNLPKSLWTLDRHRDGSLWLHGAPATLPAYQDQVWSP